MNIVYLTSEYPAISHTFIIQEILALRKLQYQHCNKVRATEDIKIIKIYTASIHRPKNIHGMGYDEKKEYGQTFYVFEKIFFQGCIALCKLLFCSPQKAFRLLYNTFSWCVLNGPKSFPKAMAYALEACMLDTFCKKNNITHLHVHFANAASTVAMLLSSISSVSFSISAHGPDIFYNCNENLLALKGSKAIFIRCISNYCSSQFMRLLPPSDWKKLHVVRCGVDIITCNSNANMHNKNVESYTKSENKIIKFLCTGRLCSAKAQALLLESFIELYKTLDIQGIKVDLTIVGGFSGTESSINENINSYIFSSDTDYSSNKKLLHGLKSEICFYRDIVKKSNIKNISDFVHFTGPVSHNEALRALRTTDIFVLPSFAEGIPMVLMEAMSMSIPCISTRIAGIAELIEHEKNGLLCHAGDAKSLIECMNRLVTDDTLRNKLGNAGQKTIFSNYNLHNNSKRLNLVFEKYLFKENSV